MNLYADDEADVDDTMAELLDDMAEGDDPEGGDSELNQAITGWPVDIDRLAAARSKVMTKDTLFVEMIETINRLQQSHGDADPALSHALADIDAHLRVHVLFIFNDPIGWVLSILATMPADRQLREIERGLLDLTKRKSQLLQSPEGE